VYHQEIIAAAGTVWSQPDEHPGWRRERECGAKNEQQLLCADRAALAAAAAGLECLAFSFIDKKLLPSKERL
jgi:hypothetical protein